MANLGLQGDGGAHAAGILFGLVRGPEARKAAIASPEVVALLVAALQVGRPQAVAWYGNFDIVLALLSRFKPDLLDGFVSPPPPHASYDALFTVPSIWGGS